jgi:hypothetical protein
MNFLRAKLMKFIYDRIFTCTELARLSSRAMEKPLPRRTRFKIFMHMRMCMWCRRYRDQIRTVRHAASHRDERLDGTVLALDHDAKDRMKSALREATDKNHGAAGPNA